MVTSREDQSSTPQPFLHDDSGTVRFWVPMTDGTVMGATISRATLHFRFGGDINGDNAVATYLAHRDEIDAAVQRRVAKGSIEPVMLREFDLPPPPRA